MAARGEVYCENKKRQKYLRQTAEKYGGALDRVCSHPLKSKGLKENRDPPRTVFIATWSSGGVALYLSQSHAF